MRLPEKLIGKRQSSTKDRESDDNGETNSRSGDVDGPLYSDIHKQCSSVIYIALHRADQFKSRPT